MRRPPLSHAALALLLTALAGPAAAGTRIDLGGAWQFRIDADGSGGRQGWASAVPSPVETVDVPHTWGIGPHAEHEGLAWYWKRVDVPPALRGRRLELHFGATFYKARVFVNGALVGEHEGGHTAWFVDVTRALGNGGLVAVEIDNRPGLATIPGWAMRLEGHRQRLVRLVALRRHRARRGPRGAGGALIRRQEIRAKVGGGPGDRDHAGFLEGRRRPLTLDAQVVGPTGRRRGDEPARPCRSAPGRRRSTLSFEVPEPRLWHFDEPSLYTMELPVQDGRGACSTSARRPSAFERSRSATGGCGSTASAFASPA